MLLTSPFALARLLRYVHVSCLRRWAIKDKDERICVVTSVGGDNNYTCTVCKSPYIYE